MLYEGKIKSDVRADCDFEYYHVEFDIPKNSVLPLWDGDEELPEYLERHIYNTLLEGMYIIVTDWEFNEQRESFGERGGSSSGISI